MISLDDLRNLSARVLSGLSLFLTMVVVGFEFLFQGQLGLASILVGGLTACVLVGFVTSRNTQMFRFVIVTALMGQVVALLIAAQGHPWQIDMHMTFFAVLALCALTYDWKAVVLGAGLVAVHHLGLGLTFHELVFYGESNFMRIVLHAVILIVEAAGLLWLTFNTSKLLSLAEEKSSEAAQEAVRVTQMSETVDKERSENIERRDALMKQLENSVGTAVQSASEGDFSHKVEANFDDNILDGLAHSINKLIATVDSGLAESVEVLDSLAHQNLTKRIEGQYSGAFGELTENVNAVADSLARDIGKLQTTSAGVKTATGEILSGANDLSERTTKQAATIEETSATMEQLAQTVVTNAENAEKAHQGASSVRQVAEQGGEVMSQATQAMERITNSSSKISNIIGMIDDIAFQTNLLALNASVEAARAGEAGKGFAVVAVEVRRLAQSAAEASSEVKELVEQSADEVNGGSKLVADASEKLTAMMESIQDNAQMINTIADASRQQASNIEEVTASVRQLDEMTQHNAALVEETNAAIEQTENQASELDRIVDQFQLEGSKNAASARAEESEETGIQGLKDKVKKAAKTYLTAGNAAVSEDWSEF